MRNLNKPNRYNVASIQAQQTMGGDVMQSDENGQYVEWRDYKWLLDSYAFVRDQWKDLDSENASLKAEVERLRIAGTYLCSTMEVNGIHDNGDIEMHERAIALWRAAKEGKQS